MNAADSILEPQAVCRRRAFAIVLAIFVASAVMPFVLAGLVTLALGIPFGETKNAVLTLIGAALVTVALIFRIRGYLLRGQLVADAGREPRRKLFAWLAVVSLVAGIVIVEAVRREAEIAPVHSRIQQLIALRQSTLSQTQNLLDQRRSLLAVLPPDLNGAQQIGQRIQQAEAVSGGLGNLIALETAEERRLTYRLLPNWTEVAQSQENLRHAVATIPSRPWSFLASMNTLQLYMAIFAFINGFTMLLIAVGHRQLREHGIWNAGLLVPWKRISSYRWDNDVLIARIGKMQPPMALPISSGHKSAVEELLRFYVPANQ